MVSDAYQQQTADRAMAEAERMAAVGHEVYDFFEDTEIAEASRELAASLQRFREAVRLYAIRNGLAGPAR
jgi:hypothetical protein